MSSKRQKAVIVGCGGFARNYLRVYKGLEFVQPVLCYDLDSITAQNLAKALGTADWTADFKRVMETDADFAVVSTPNAFHFEHATELLRSGKHVLLQKPMARWLWEAKALRESAIACSGRKLGMYMSMLDFSLWWDLRAAIASGRVFGDIVEISVRLGHTGGLVWKPTDSSTWRFSKEQTGGGAFVMLGVHYIHLIRWLTGRRIDRVRARGENLHCPQIEGEDICQVQAELSNGAFCQITVSWNSNGEHFALYGTEGTLVYLDNEVLRVNARAEWRARGFTYNRAGQWQTFMNVVPPPLDDHTNALNQHRQFAEAIRDGHPPATNVDEGLCDMRAVDAVYRSIVSGQWEAVSYE